jgi:hypothetical protein
MSFPCFFFVWHSAIIGYRGGSYRLERRAIKSHGGEECGDPCFFFVSGSRLFRDE